MTRISAMVAVIVALAAAGCGDSTGSPSTAAPPVSAPGEPTAAAITVPPPPDGPDFDGDGTTDTLVIRRLDDGTWAGEVVWGSGGVEPVDLQLAEPATIGPLRTWAWADVDGNGADEALAVAFTGADHFRLGVFTLVDGKLTRIVDDVGAPAELHISGGSMFTTGFDCPGDGTILVHEYVRDPGAWRHTITTLRLDGPVLTAGDTIDAEPVPLDAEIPPFACGEVVPFSGPGE